MPASPPIRRACVVDAHPALADLVGSSLEGLGFEVARVTTAEAALATVPGFGPDLVVGDPSLTTAEGTPVLAALRVTLPATTRIVAFADAAALGHVRATVLDGVDAIVAKQAPVDELLRVALAPPGGPRHVGESFRAEQDDRQLTSRERVTLRLLADGLGYREIAARLGVAPETVRVHATMARKRLGAATRTQAVATALRTKLID